MALPSFNEHEGHLKLSPLQGPEKPRALIVEWLSRVSEGRERSDIRVLDLGCGRGGTVAWLVDQGFDGYGIDVRPEYIENGRLRLGPDRLAVLEGDCYPYPDDFFDVVVSDQVFEHVADLGQLAREVTRTTRPGGLGLHVFPGKWIVTEPHLLAPFVHWLPKGPWRRRAIELALRVGRAAPYFSQYTLAERATIFADYSEEETFYRRPAEIRRMLTSAGLSVDYEEVLREQLLAKLGNPQLPTAIGNAFAWGYRNTRTMCVTTVKNSRPIVGRSS